MLNKSLVVILCISFFNHLSAQEVPIPEIDWKALQLTKPWEATEDTKTKPTKITPGTHAYMAPSDATILFDGSDISLWQKPKYGIGADYSTTNAITQNRMLEDNPGTAAEWTVRDGYIEVKPGGGNIETKKAYGDVQLHIEWLSPVDTIKRGQLYSNSGVFFMGLYEVQVLNSYDNETYGNGQAGAVYKQSPPSVNASRPAGEWQVYDIIFTAPRFDSKGSVVQKAALTVIHNGVVIQNHFECEGPTFYIGKGEYFSHAEKLPLLLQDHGDKVKFRNIWIREL